MKCAKIACTGIATHAGAEEYLLTSLKAARWHSGMSGKQRGLNDQVKMIPRKQWQWHLKGRESGTIGNLVEEFQNELEKCCKHFF